MVAMAVGLEFLYRINPLRSTNTVMASIGNNDWKSRPGAPILSLCAAPKARATEYQSLPDGKESAMANQEYPIFALHRGATLLGDALMPQDHHRPTPAATPRHSLLDRLDAWFWRQRQRADETYLAQSHDVFELERRMRELERTVGSRYY
jgi:hypothetical protein